MKTVARPLFQYLRSSAWRLPFAVLAALVILAINEVAYDGSTDALESVGQRASARTQIQLAWRALIDAETGQRGYLLTGRKEYLEPYHNAITSVDEAMQWLGRYYAGDAAGGPMLQTMKKASDVKLSELATTLNMHAEGAESAWRELVLTDIGREQMDAFRLAASQLLTLETQRVAAERRGIFSTLRAGRIGVGAMTLLGLLALFLFLRQTLALDRSQRDHADAMQAERDRLQAEATLRTADLTELARHLQTAREDERSRLARELHDELGALLTAAKLDTARLKRAIGPPTADVQERLNHLNDSINRGIELKRRIIEDLRPSSLSNLGLVAALEILTREHAARSEAALKAELEHVSLSPAAQITVYRLVQEALTNISKYARARQVQVSLLPQLQDGRAGATVAVRDDGVGFDLGVRRNSTHGLMGMRYRVEAEGGTMRVLSQPQQGTCIEAWLPVLPVLPEPADGDDAVDGPRAGFDPGAGAPAPATRVG
ncbi:MAG: CHASE3 domain-containing protein [Rubrivivax sp.]|nr:CHASE3 domain-containing protein [Rubrivivax sp.]